MKILNLFAGIGGNRKFWKGDVVAVESDPDTVPFYRANFPDDQIVQADAYEYIVSHIDDGWDFIWASPPCKTHSRLNITGQNIRLPDFRLYELITFLKHFGKCPWVVENVIPYYTPLIKPTIKIDRHLYWSNFPIQPLKINSMPNFKDLPLPALQEYIGLVCDKREYLRNCELPQVGLYLLKQSQQKLLFKEANING